MDTAMLTSPERPVFRAETSRAGYGGPTSLVRIAENGAVADVAFGGARRPRKWPSTASVRPVAGILGEVGAERGHAEHAAARGGEAHRRRACASPGVEDDARPRGRLAASSPLDGFVRRGRRLG